MTDLDQRVQTILLLALHSGFFVRATDRAVIAHPAGSGLRSGRQEAFFDGMVYGLEYPAEPGARFVVEGDVDIGEIAALGTEKEPAGLNRLAEQCFGSEGIEQRLE